MTVIDVDSHFFEPWDWLADTDAEAAAQLPPVDRVTLVATTAFGEVLSTLPPQFRPDVYRSFPGVRAEDGSISPEGMAKAEEALVAVIESVSGGHRPDERVAFLDAHGIDRQFVLPTFAFNPISWARRERPDLAGRLMQAYNRWSTEHLAGHRERLLPVVIVDHKSMDRPVVEAELAGCRERGARSVLFWPSPVGGRSLAHPDFEWFWAACAGLGVMPMVHVGAGRPSLDPGWFENGREFPGSLVTNFSQLHQIPELILAELLAAGIFERHPDLRVLVCELGVDWLPAFSRRLDGLARIGRDLGAAWPHPELPGEYLRTNVRVSPLTPDPTARVIEELGPGMVVFSTDYPHPEGDGNAVETYRRRLEGKVEATAVADFFGGTIEADLSLAA